MLVTIIIIDCTLYNQVRVSMLVFISELENLKPRPKEFPSAIDGNKHISDLEVLVNDTKFMRTNVSASGQWHILVDNSTEQCL